MVTLVVKKRSEACRVEGGRYSEEEEDARLSVT
jgi:hypothetical protein